jgi:hypothetical protein
MPQRVREALEKSDSSLLLSVLAEGFSEGVTARDFAEEGLRVLLESSAWDLQGARWTHAFLCLDAARNLAVSGPEELARPAVSSALAFLDGSSPTRGRPLDASLTGAEPGRLEEWVYSGDLCRAESSLIALLPEADIERRWFDLSLSNLEGWGHRALTGSACWRLEQALDVESGRLLRAGLRQWLPWEEDRSADWTSEQSGPSLGSIPVGEEEQALWIANKVLQGVGARAVAHGLECGWSSESVLDGILRSSCRIFAALPELRQLHGVTVGRTFAEAVLHHGAAAKTALPQLAWFVGDGWRLAQRSRRILPGQEKPELGAAGPAAAPGLDVSLCSREATPNFGHLIKLVDAVRALPSLMSGDGGGRWGGDVLRAAERTATPYRRVWATVSRQMADRAEE